MQTQKSLSGRSFGILGDSYSTFQGYIPEDYLYYYPAPERVDDVLAVEDTWWHILMRQNDLQLVRNNSYSGSTVCTHVRENHPKSGSFVARAKDYFSGDVPMDYIFIFGGTNDSWLDRPAGQLQFSDWTEEDLMQVLPAYCNILDHITKHNPQSKVIAVVNTDLNREIHNGIMDAAIHYGVTVVVLCDIDKQNGHPSALGMRQIAEQIAPAL
jgi:hypothetical protein